MSVLLAISMMLSQAMDPIPPPYAPPADEVATEEAPPEQAPEPEPLPSPRAYLYAEYPGLARKLDCMIQRESSWNPVARSGPTLASRSSITRPGSKLRLASPEQAVPTRTRLSTPWPGVRSTSATAGGRAHRGSARASHSP